VLDKWILVTGGMGFIGSHTCVELLNCGFKIVILDNLDNSDISVLDRIIDISCGFPLFYKIDLSLDSSIAEIEELFEKHPFCAVIHFAGYKAVGESVAQPLKYYDNNLKSTINLLKVMKKKEVKNLVFSSSATVYGFSTPPFSEELPLCSINPYGRTKLFIEEMCRDLAAADPDWQIILLRYFNPIGAHPSGKLGEDPQGMPNNLMPFAMQVATGLIDKLQVFGNDYPTHDGTCIRDYIHVVDLAKGHLAALNLLLTNQKSLSCEAINLGSGKGHSVLEVINAVNEATNLKIPFFFGPRRSGDAVESYAAIDKAKSLLNWETELTLLQSAKDSWLWQKNTSKKLTC
jgi:UDP-glucose 4-epimerase